jgi:biopolymer transport protein ExbD
MKTRSGHSHGQTTLAELNITPLLDLVFVLLVIFIITTPQMMNNLEMTLPSGKPPPKQDQTKPKIQRIVINGAGQVTLNDEALTLSGLKERLASLKTANSDLSAVVKGADDVNYQAVVNVLDILRQLDITKVGLATDSSTLPHE